MAAALTQHTSPFPSQPLSLWRGIHAQTHNIFLSFDLIKKNNNNQKQYFLLASLYLLTFNPDCFTSKLCSLVI